MGEISIKLVEYPQCRECPQNESSGQLIPVYIGESMMKWKCTNCGNTIEQA